MTAKEKAKELVNKYWNTHSRITLKTAKKLALIAADEIIREVIIFVGGIHQWNRKEYWIFIF